MATWDTYAGVPPSGRLCRSPTFPLYLPMFMTNPAGKRSRCVACRSRCVMSSCAGLCFGGIGWVPTSPAQSLLRLIPTRDCEVQGRVHFEGRDLLQLSDAEMRELRGNRIAMVFQDPMTSLNPVLRVGDQIRNRSLNIREFLKRSPKVERLNC